MAAAFPLPIPLPPAAFATFGTAVAGGVLRSAAAGGLGVRGAGVESLPLPASSFPASAPPTAADLVAAAGAIAVETGFGGAAASVEVASLKPGGAAM